MSRRPAIGEFLPSSTGGFDLVKLHRKPFWRAVDPVLAAVAALGFTLVLRPV